MTFTSEDSLKVTENDDGTLGIEWDPNDPRYAIFNDMTQDELQEYITRALEEFIKQHEENESV
jgi:hexokinase